MRNSINQFAKSAFICCSLIFLVSCSTESISEPTVDSVISVEKLPGLSSFISESSGCSSSEIPSSSPIYADDIDVGNGKQAKTLKTSVYSTDTHIFVEADYIITAENENLPGQVKIDIGGTAFNFQDVNPGEKVEAKLEIPREWFGTYVDVHVTQIAFLEPAEVLVNFFVDEPCPLEIGAKLKGGIIAYILQPEDPGYDPNEQHGLVVAPNDAANSYWWDYNYNNANLVLIGADLTALGTGYENTQTIVNAFGLNGSYAARYCDELVENGYSDWFLPSEEELHKILSNAPAIGNMVYTGYDFELHKNYAYWSSTEWDYASAVIVGYQEGNVYSGGEDRVLSGPATKNVSGPKVRAVRYF